MPPGAQIYARLSPDYNGGATAVTGSLWRLNATDPTRVVGPAAIRTVAVRQPIVSDQWQLLLAECVSAAAASHNLEPFMSASD